MSRVSCRDSAPPFFFLSRTRIPLGRRDGTVWGRMVGCNWLGRALFHLQRYWWRSARPSHPCVHDPDSSRPQATFGASWGRPAAKILPEWRTDGSSFRRTSRGHSRPPTPCQAGRFLWSAAPAAAPLPVDANTQNDDKQLMCNTLSLWRPTPLGSRSSPRSPSSFPPALCSAVCRGKTRSTRARARCRRRRRHARCEPHGRDQRGSRGSPITDAPGNGVAARRAGTPLLRTLNGGSPPERFNWGVRSRGGGPRGLQRSQPASVGSGGHPDY